jgi:hopanoid biosynthesis associated protein HpnK
LKRVIFSADDFGLSEAVNEAVERAHREGILGAASLMVAGAAADDAVRRARALPNLRVGLHLVVIEGPSVLWAEGGEKNFGSDQVRRGFSYFFRPGVRRRLAAEIDAQFAAFAATGLDLDHADAHKHMHLHPTVGRLMIDIGRHYGLRAVRIPAEPPSVMEKCGHRPGIGGWAMATWSGVLRAQARRAGLVTNDHAFGIAWSGHMTADRVRRLAAALPDGLSEIYFHPASRRDAVLDRLMPGYEHEAEFLALCDPGLPASLAAVGAVTTDYTSTSPVTGRRDNPKDTR